MGLAQEIRDFVAAFSGMTKAIGDPEDKAYKKLRNQLLQFRLNQAQKQASIAEQLRTEQEASKSQRLDEQTETYKRNFAPSGPSPLAPGGSPRGALDETATGAPAIKRRAGPSASEWGVPTSAGPSSQQLPTSVDTGGGEEPEQAIPVNDSGLPLAQGDDTTDTFDTADSELYNVG